MNVEIRRKPWNNTNNRGANGAKTVDLVCENCGKTFWRYASWMEKYKPIHVHCSTECRKVNGWGAIKQNNRPFGDSAHTFCNQKERDAFVGELMIFIVHNRLSYANVDDACGLNRGYTSKMIGSPPGERMTMNKKYYEAIRKLVNG